MNRTFRHVLMSTSLGLAIAVLQMPSAEAQDSTSCMQDVQMLRDHAAIGKGGDTAIEASASAAEEACLAGDYGQASAYIADAERRLDLREAQRDGFDATDDTQEAAASPGGAALGSEDGDRFADDVEDAANDIGDDVEDVADDVGDELGDVASDIGDAFDGGLDDNDVHLPARSEVLGTGTASVETDSDVISR
jgi:hypothetical protein